MIALVALAGGLGAVLRFVVDGAIGARFAGPLGVPFVNVTGSFAMGLVVGWFGGGELAEILGTGLLGGYTTFSAASLDAVRLVGTDGGRAAVGYAVGSFVLSVLAAAVGLWIAG